MITIYQQCVKTNVFPSLYIYFSHFFIFFPSPNPSLANHGKNGNFFYFQNRNFASLSFHILFCPSPNPNFGVSWAKIGLDSPNKFFYFWQRVIFSFLAIYYAFYLFFSLSMLKSVVRQDFLIDNHIVLFI